MKKILIVDDTKENLTTAKIFFSKISGFEFFYAKNLKEGLGFLDQVDAVITDQNMPYSKTEVLFNEELLESMVNLELSEDNIKENNGNHLFLKSLQIGKPTVMIRSHGGLIIEGRKNLKIKVDIESWKDDDNLSEILKDFMEKKTWDSKLGITILNDYHFFSCNPTFNKPESDRMEFEKLTKEDEISWELALEKLLYGQKLL